MFHTLVQTQPRPSTAELVSVTRTFRGALALIHDLGIACKTASTITLFSVLRTKVVASATCTRTTLDCHAVAGSNSGGEYAISDVICIAALVAIVGDCGILGDHDVCVGLENCHTVGSTAELRCGPGAWHTALAIRLGFDDSGEDP